jgi:hypothetical protein
MKILLATFFLRDWTGSELFTVELARALAARGHEVHLHAPAVGALARQLIDEGFEVTPRLPDLAAVDFDVAHVHHNVVATAVRAAFPALPMVMLMHGVLPPLEQPPSSDLRIAKLLCVSEEVESHVQDRGTFGAATEVVRNFVSLEYWCPRPPVSPKLRRVLVLSNDYPPEMRAIVEAACALAGVEVEHVGLPENQRRDVKPSIQRADLVISLGRGAIQAMAMKRNVLVLGSRGGDGLVDEHSFFEFRRHNFSGRAAMIEFTPETLAAEMLRYDPRLGPLLSGLVKTENAETGIVDRLERIYQEAARQKIAPTDVASPSPEFSALYQEVCGSWELLGAREAELAAVYASESWRSTAAFRRLLSLLRRPAPQKTGWESP